MKLTELATTIGVSLETANSLLNTHGIKLDAITQKEVESLKVAVTPGVLTTKPQKKAPSKQLGGDPKLSITRGVTATLTPPEVPKVEASHVLPSMSLSDVTAHFTAITAGASLPIEQAAREGILQGAAIAQEERSITDNFLRDVLTSHYQTRLPQ